MTNHLYRSRTDCMLGGVCGGLGRYLSIDPTLVRLFFVLLALADGIGLLLYFILWVIVPREDLGSVTTEEAIRTGAEEIAERARTLSTDLGKNLQASSQQAGLIVGAVLIILGGLLFLENLRFPWLWWLRLDVLWPLLLILAGAVLIWRRGAGG